MMFLNTLPEIFDLGPNEVIIEVVPKLVKSSALGTPRR